MKFSSDELRAPVPAGTYVLRIVDVVQRESRNANPIVEVQFEVQDEDFGGQIIRDHFVTGGANSGAARVGRRRLLRLCQLSCLEPKPGEELELSLLIGHHVVAEVSEDTYRGMRVSRVRSYRAGSLGIPPVF